MAKSVIDKIQKTLKANRYGLLQIDLAHKVDSSPGYVRKLTREMEKEGLCKIKEYDRPRRIMIYPADEQ
jgi:ribosomal protein S25